MLDQYHGKGPPASEASTSNQQFDANAMLQPINYARIRPFSQQNDRDLEPNFVRSKQQNLSPLPASSSSCMPSHPFDSHSSLQFGVSRQYARPSFVMASDPPPAFAHSPWNEIAKTKAIDQFKQIQSKKKGKQKQKLPEDEDFTANGVVCAPESVNPPSSCGGSSCEMNLIDQNLRENPSSPNNKLKLPLQPIRIRRVGALGISVDSDSTNRSQSKVASVKSAGRKRSRAKRSQDLSPSPDSSEEGDESAEMDLDEPMTADNNIVPPPWRKRKRDGVTEDAFRQIVDELAVENQELKAKLRRYEAAQMPTGLRKDRLFEIRYFDRLEKQKRVDLERFLTNYVQKITNDAEWEKPSLVQTIYPTTDSSPLNLPLPVIPDRRPKKSTRNHRQRDLLAGPSNSGLEPPSLTGTGCGIKVDTSGDEVDSWKMKRANKKSSKLRNSHNFLGNSAENVKISSESEISTALEIVRVIEKLFTDSCAVPPLDDKMMRSHTVDSNTAAQLKGTNEEYLGHLLDKDFIAGGWIYTNLILTMARIYRFSVTTPFIRAALRKYSTQLELSSDGTKLRWKPETRRRASLISNSSERPNLERQPTSESTVATLATTRSQSHLQPPRPASAAPSTSDVTSLSSGERATVSTAATSVLPENFSQVKSSKNSTQRPSAQPLQSHGEEQQIQPLGSELVVTSLGNGERVAVPSRLAAYRPTLDLPQKLEGSEGSAGSRAEHRAKMDSEDKADIAAHLGTMLFYTSAQFYSDLSKEIPNRILLEQETNFQGKPLGADHVTRSSETRFSLLGENSNESDEIVHDASAAAELKVYNPPNSLAEDFEPETETNFGEMSGMTQLVAADHFNITCLTLRSTARSAQRIRQLPINYLATRINKLVPRIRKRRKLSENAIRLSSDEETESESEEFERNDVTEPQSFPSRSESNSQSSSAPKPFYSPSPDYLLSLNLPFLAWAPKSPGSAFHWSQTGNRAKTAPKIPTQTSTEAGAAGISSLGRANTSSEEDLAPIDLDEAVSANSAARTRAVAQIRRE